MDLTNTIQMLFGGGAVAGLCELFAWFRHRKADKVKVEAEAKVSDVEAQKAEMELADLYKEKVLNMIELVSAKQDNGTAKQDKMIAMLGNLDSRVDSLESRVGKIEKKLEGGSDEQ